MKRRLPADSEAAHELLIYLDNDPTLYEQKLAIAKNLYAKMQRGKYEHKLSVLLWSYVVERAARMYATEFAIASDWARIFTPATRDVVARDLADRWRANAKAGRPAEV